MKLQRTLIISILFIIPISCFSSDGIAKQEAESAGLDKTLGADSMLFLKPTITKNKVIKRIATYLGIVETGIDNKLLVLNNDGEFCYLDLTDINKPKLEVITPNFPGVLGALGSDAENRVAWLVGGLHIAMIDLDTKKTKYMRVGYQTGRILDVMMTDKKRLLFAIFSYIPAGATLLDIYELGNDTNHGTRAAADYDYYTLGNDTLLYRRVFDPTDKTYRYSKEVYENPPLDGWYLTDTFSTSVQARNKKDPKSTPSPEDAPLTKMLTEKKVDGAVGMFQKQLHQGKRMLFTRIPIEGTYSTQDAMVRWSEDLQEVKIEPLSLQMVDKRSVYNTGPYHMSGDGNWMTGIRDYLGERGGWSGYGTIKEELLIYHLQDHYPQGVSMPINLGSTEKDKGAFLNHSTLGPLYVELQYEINNTIRIYKLNDGLEILKEQAILKLTEEPRTLNDILREYKVGKEAVLHAAVEEGDIEAVQILINAGVLVNKQANDGWTPFGMASLFSTKNIRPQLMLN